MLHSPKWNTLHDIKQFLFTMIWIIWPAGLLQSGRFVLTFFANGPCHLEQPASCKRTVCWEIFCKWSKSSRMACLFQRGRFVLTFFANGLDHLDRQDCSWRAVCNVTFCKIWSRKNLFDCTLQIWTLLWIVSFMMEMWKWCGDSKIEMYLKYTRPAKYRGTTIGCEKCRAKCQLRCTFHFHQCRQKSRNRQWAAELRRDNPWFQLFLCAQQKMH